MFDDDDILIDEPLPRLPISTQNVPGTFINSGRGKPMFKHQEEVPMTKQLKAVPMTNGIPVEFIEPKDAILMIINLWLGWVADNASWTESCGVMSCFFCGGLYQIYGIDIDHKEDCIYKLTEEYVKQLRHRSATKDKPCSCYDDIIE